MFIYDEMGAPIALKYRAGTYAAGTFDYFFFEKNIQGDVIAIYNASGTKIGSYTYDAWGNFTVSTTGGNTTLANNIVRKYNPFHCRGYYFDVESGYGGYQMGTKLKKNRLLISAVIIILLLLISFLALNVSHIKNCGEYSISTFSEEIQNSEFAYEYRVEKINSPRAAARIADDILVSRFEHLTPKLYKYERNVYYDSSTNSYLVFYSVDPLFSRDLMSANYYVIMHENSNQTYCWGIK